MEPFWFLVRSPPPPDWPISNPFARLSPPELAVLNEWLTEFGLALVGYGVASFFLQNGLVDFQKCLKFRSCLSAKTISKK